MIRVEDLHMHFGGIRAVDGASIEIAEGSITGLIGPNGAGKSTLFNVIAGHFPPTSGRVWLDGEEITGLPPHELFHKGLLRTFQIAHEFSTLTVRENLMMVPAGAARRGALGRLVPAAAGSAPARREVRAKADEVIDFLEIGHVADERAGNLSGGQKKLLELGRTMMVDAKIVFLDEVGAGVNRTLLNTIGDAILRLNRERGYTFCMVEHDMDFIGRLCDPVIVMAEGKVLTIGAPDEVMKNEAVIEAYLGRGLKNKPARDGGGRPVSYLVGEAMTGGYGGRRHPARLHHRRRQGRDRGDRRPERRRQVDRDEGGLRHARRCARARSGSTARTSPGSPRRSGCTPAWASCRRPPTSSPP